jgi:SAM-dependent methyltransferase
MRAVCTPDIMASPTARLLPKEALVHTGPLDAADWNYRPILGYIIRERYRLALALLPAHVDSILELGYGSGVFFPELAARCDRLFGVDIHHRKEEVMAALRHHGIDAELAVGSAEQLPYPDASFDSVVAVSTLEFVDDIDAAYAEIARVLRRGGKLIVVTPNQSRLLDAGFKVLTGRTPENDFHGGRERVRSGLGRRFKILRVLDIPAVAPATLRFYTAFEATPLT